MLIGTLIIDAGSQPTEKSYAEVAADDRVTSLARQGVVARIEYLIRQRGKLKPALDARIRFYSFDKKPGGIEVEGFIVKAAGSARRFNEVTLGHPNGPERWYPGAYVVPYDRRPIMFSDIVVQRGCPSTFITYDVRTDTLKTNGCLK